MQMKACTRECSWKKFKLHFFLNSRHDDLIEIIMFCWWIKIKKKQMLSIGSLCDNFDFTTTYPFVTAGAAHS